MARERQPQADQLDPLRARVTTAPCVPEIRKSVKEWRQTQYKGASDTTKTLFNSVHRTASFDTFVVLSRLAK